MPERTNQMWGDVGVEETREGILPITNVQIYRDDSSGEFLATADVELAGICTIRNVKIKEDDYDLTVVMPKTKMVNNGRYLDTCFFGSRQMREQFDQAVREAYGQEMALEETENEEMHEGFDNSDYNAVEELEMGQDLEQEQGGIGGISL